MVQSQLNTRNTVSNGARTKDTGLRIDLFLIICILGRDLGPAFSVPHFQRPLPAMTGPSNKLRLHVSC